MAVTPIPTGATANIYGQVTGTGDGTSGVYFWGFQVEQRSALTALTQTTTAPITNYIPALQTAAEEKWNDRTESQAWMVGYLEGTIKRVILVTLVFRVGLVLVHQVIQVGLE